MITTSNELLALLHSNNLVTHDFERAQLPNELPFDEGGDEPHFFAMLSELVTSDAKTASADNTDDAVNDLSQQIAEVLPSTQAPMQKQVETKPLALAANTQSNLISHSLADTPNINDEQVGASDKENRLIEQPVQSSLIDKANESLKLAQPVTESSQRQQTEVQRQAASPSNRLVPSTDIDGTQINHAQENEIKLALSKQINEQAALSASSKQHTPLQPKQVATSINNNEPLAKQQAGKVLAHVVKGHSLVDPPKAAATNIAFTLTPKGITPKPTSAKTDLLKEQLATSLAMQGVNVVNRSEPIAPPSSIMASLQPREAASEAVFAQVNIMLAKNLKQADIRLDPPELGRLQVKLNLSQETASVQFVVSNQVVKEVIEQSMPRLREMFVQHGLQLAQSSVQQESDQQQQSLHGGQPQQQFKQQHQQQGNTHSQYQGWQDTEAEVPSIVSNIQLSQDAKSVDYYA